MLISIIFPYNIVPYHCDKQSRIGLEEKKPYNVLKCDFNFIRLRFYDWVNFCWKIGFEFFHDRIILYIIHKLSEKHKKHFNYHYAYFFIIIKKMTHERPWKLKKLN